MGAQASCPRKSSAQFGAFVSRARCPRSHRRCRVLRINHSRFSGIKFTATDASSFHLDLQSLCVSGISPAMKIRAAITLVAFLFSFSATIRARLPATHPLMNSNFEVITWQSGSWIPGWLYIHEVAAYILGSDDERSTARAALERAGYGGKNGAHYLYCGEEDEPAVADGQPFKTRGEAIKYLHDQKVTEATYISTKTSFPRTIPAELTWEGTAFRALSWHK